MNIQLIELEKSVTITAYNNSQVSKPSKFIIHTATPCYMIDKVFFEFDFHSFEIGMKLAGELRDTINNFRLHL